VDVDLTSAPARLLGEVTLAGAKLQLLASRFPPALRKARGGVSGTAQFETRGLSRSEMGANLTARATVQLKGVSFGEFDPLQSVARHAGWGTLEPPRGEVALPSASLTVAIRDRRVVVTNQLMHVEGAGLTLNGAYNFDGAIDLAVRADFRHVKRRWISVTTEHSLALRQGDFHLVGPLAQPTVQPEVQVSQASR
jgi:hypothetical protein